MAGDGVSRPVRRQVRSRARDCCEYCRHPASYSNAPYVCEHIWPRARGAGNALEELAWSYPACNLRKSDRTRVVRSGNRPLGTFVQSANARLDRAFPIRGSPNRRLDSDRSRDRGHPRSKPPTPADHSASGGSVWIVPHVTMELRKIYSSVGAMTATFPAAFFILSPLGGEWV
jgi:hypothetical protein